jgi:hypothetical protein
MCKEPWQSWPKTNLALSDIVNYRFPGIERFTTLICVGRRKRAEAELLAESEAQRKELEKVSPSLQASLMW